MLISVISRDGSTSCRIVLKPILATHSGVSLAPLTLQIAASLANTLLSSQDSSLIKCPHKGYSFSSFEVCNYRA